MNDEEASRFLPIIQHAVEAEMSPAGIAYKLGTLEAAVVALKDQVGSLHVDIARAQQQLGFIKHMSVACRMAFNTRPHGRG